MNTPDFHQILDRLQAHLLEASTAFLTQEGLKADWLSYWTQMSTDLDQHAREILFFAGDCWPVVEESA